MKHTKNPTGFTMVELLITLSLAAMLIGLAAPFVSTLRVDIAMQKTLKNIKFELVSALNYSLAGKSFATLDKKDLEKVSFIPQVYGFYLQKGEYGHQPNYRYLEFKVENAELSIIYQKEHPLPSSEVFLSQIRLVDGEGVKPVDGVLILIKPPYGTIEFLELESLDQTVPFSSQATYEEIHLSFQYKENQASHETLIFDQFKQFSL